MMICRPTLDDIVRLWNKLPKPPEHIEITVTMVGKDEKFE